MWRHRGLPHYLNIQGARLGLSRVLSDIARRNPELKRCATLLAQLSDRFGQFPVDDDGHPVIFPAELRQVEGTLLQCEQELQKLHALAAAAQMMVDEARPAFGLAIIRRPMRVTCDFDEVTGDGQANGSAHARSPSPKAKAKA